MGNEIFSYINNNKNSINPSLLSQNLNNFLTEQGGGSSAFFVPLTFVREEEEEEEVKYIFTSTVSPGTIVEKYENNIPVYLYGEFDEKPVVLPVVAAYGHAIGDYDIIGNYVVAEDVEVIAVPQIVYDNNSDEYVLSINQFEIPVIPEFKGTYYLRTVAQQPLSFGANILLSDDDEEIDFSILPAVFQSIAYSSSTGGFASKNCMVIIKEYYTETQIRYYYLPLVRWDPTSQCAIFSSIVFDGSDFDNEAAVFSVTINCANNTKTFFGKLL